MLSLVGSDALGSHWLDMMLWALIAQFRHCALNCALIGPQVIFYAANSFYSQLVLGASQLQFSPRLPLYSRQVLQSKILGYIVSGIFANLELLGLYSILDSCT